MRSQGFSIIELLISVAVIGIISVFTFAGYRYSGRIAKLENEAQKIVGEIESVRGMSYSGLDIERENGERVEEFTIDFYESHYILMKGTDEERKGDLESGAYVPDESRKRVAFVPPEPEAFFYDSNGNIMDKNYADIEFKFRDLDQSKTIRVNKIGLVQILE